MLNVFNHDDFDGDDDDNIFQPNDDFDDDDENNMFQPKRQQTKKKGKEIVFLFWAVII